MYLYKLDMKIIYEVHYEELDQVEKQHMRERTTEELDKLKQDQLVSEEIGGISK